MGADLGSALEHLLGQALVHQYPDHPHFEREVRKVDCEKVLAEVQKAARVDDGRIEVDRALRPAIKAVTNPLGLGLMGEQYFVLEKTWQTHFNRQLAAEKKTDPTAANLRSWMDRPKSRGLLSEVGNLLILAFAEQTNRSFTLRGRPFTPTLDHLPDEAELKLQPLPPEGEWDEVRRRAKEIFGVVGFESSILTAANVAVLAGRVRDRAEVAGHEVAREVRQALARLGTTDAEIDEAPRWRTARSVEGLLVGLAGQDATPALLHLARAPLDTSAAAMGRSLAKAADLVRALKDVRWELFEGVARLGEDREGEAQELMDGLRKSLMADEYVTALESRLDEAQTKAIRLLSPRKPIRSPDRIKREQDDRRGEEPRTWTSIEDGRLSITAEDCEAEIARIVALLKGGVNRRLVLDWSLEEGAP